MLDNSNNSSFNPGSSQGYAVWQSEWMEELWNQLTNGTYNGLGNVIVDGDIAQSEQQILADLNAIDRMLLGEKDIRQSLLEVRDFATKGFDALNRNSGTHSNIDSITGVDFTAQARQAARSLTEVMQYVQAQGLPDLTAEVGELTFDNIALPSEKANLSVTLTNQGGLKSHHPVTAKIFAQAASVNAAAGSEQNSPIEIGALNFGKLKLSPGDKKKVSAPVQLPDYLLPGEYNIFVAIDTNGNVPEADEANNIIVASYTQTVAWKFGNLDGENRQLTIADEDGDTIRFRLKGDGYGEITAYQGKKQLALYGTTDKSEVVIQSNGDGHVLDSVVVDGDLRRFNAQNTDLQGNLTINGGLEKLELDDVSNAQIVIGQSTNPNRKLDVELGKATDVSLRSEVKIHRIKTAAWTTSADAGNLLIAPEIKELDVKGDFDANLTVAGGLETIKVKGTASGIWMVGQNNRLTKVISTTSDWSLSVGGSLNYLDVQGHLQGTVAAESMKRAFVRGDMNNAKLLMGTDLGADGVVGGDDDSYDKGELKELIVRGNVLSSVIGAGLDPRDTDFNNGNEQLITGGKISLIDIRGTVSSDSLLATDIWPKRARIRMNGQIVNPETDARFLTHSKVVFDGDAPVVTLALAEDTGDTTDRLTSVATVIGTVTDISEVVSLKAGFVCV